MAKKRKNGNDTPFWVRLVCGALGVLMVLGILFMAVPYMGQSIAYAEETAEPSAVTLPTDEMISVGLHCENEAVASFSVQSDNGFHLAYRKSDSSLGDLIDHPAGGITIALDGNLYRYGSGLTTENLGIAAMGGYHIQITYFTFSELGIDDRDNPVYIDPSVSAGVTEVYTRGTVAEYIAQLESISAVQAMGQPIFPYFTAQSTYIRLGSYYTAEEAKAALTELEKTLTLKAEVVSPSKDALTVFDSSTWEPVCELSTETYMLSLTSESDKPFSDPIGHAYSGELLFDRVSESFGGLVQVINRLPLEEYVAALLSYEVSAQENAELLKAMAILLRTEAIRHTDAHKANGYDVCSDSHCHRFSGSMANADSIRKAVLDTAGMRLTFGGKAIYTPYMTESGATTLSAEDAFGKDVAYLPALTTPWEDKNAAQADRWTVELTPYELFRMLSDAGLTDLKGNIAKVSVTSKAEGSDYVTELTFTDQFGNSALLSGSEHIRALFGGLLPSTNFAVGKAGEKITLTKRTMSGEGLEYTESTESLTLEGTYDSFIFSGRGVGCGVGLSIAGCRALAEMGYSYDQMLSIYYPETKITQ